VSRRAAACLELLTAVFLGATLAAAHSGPLRFEVYGASLSIRTLSRPLVAAALMFALRLWWLRGASFPTAAFGVMARVISGALITAGVIGWIHHNSPTLGGADSYGYVSAAERLLAGDLVHDEPLAAILPANGAHVSMPLGYVPSGRTPNASVPAYPLGLPAVMALAIATFGPTAPFFVAPACGALLLVAVYLTAWYWFRDRDTALLATGLVALHPVVFAYSIQPMSDVPAALGLTAAVAALSRVPSRPVLAGCAGALTLLIRPALAPAAFALAFLPPAVIGQRGVSPALWYVSPVIAGAIVQGSTQWYLYGDPLASGYGSVAALFTLETFGLNFRSYLYWGFLTLGPVWLAGLVPGVAYAPRLPRAAVTLLVLGVSAPYFFYRPYDHWETLRFLLPALVALTILVALGLRWIGRRAAGEARGTLVASFLAMVMAYTWVSWLSSNQVFYMPEHEARHRVVGELVARVTPEQAVILALQHSGSVRYYARRETLNWNQIPAGQFTPTVQAIQAHGLPVYLLIDSDEERVIFEGQHGLVVENEGWRPNDRYRNVQLFEAPGQQASQAR
jgi:hypothetical protein